MTALRWLAMVAALTMASALFAASLAPAHAQSVEDVIYERAEAHGVSGDYLAAVAWCESTYDPYAVGAAGELGLFQLHPYGLLPSFYGLGYTDPWDVWEQADYAAWAFSVGLASHWSCS